MSVAFGTSAWLDGSAAGLDHRAPFTICAWIKPNVTTWQSLVGCSATGTDDEMSIANDTVWYAENRFNGAYPGDASGGSASTSLWKFVAMRRTSASAFSLRVDGVTYAGTPVDVSSAPATNTFYIAAWAGLAGGTDATIAHVRVWTTALTDGELWDEEHSGVAVHTANLWAEYRLGSAATAANDYSGNSRTLTVYGTPTDGTSEPLQLTPSVNLIYRARQTA